jgi:tRNA1Val (adenine37-N6)-methyltransferase
MSNPYFEFKHFTVYQDHCAMKVATDGCLFGGWIADENKSEQVKAERVLDIGSGTGLLSLMYAQKNPSSKIDAIEIDEDACRQAMQNIAASPFAKQIEVIHGDVKRFASSKKYDCIISNPPFYEKEITSNDNKKNIAHHHSGLRLEELLNIIRESLSPTGTFYLLLPFKRNEEIRKILLKQGLWVSKILFVRQSTQHNYFRMMIAGKLDQENGAETFIEQISIRDDQRQYTKEFKELLKDYYLYL